MTLVVSGKAKYTQAQGCLDHSLFQEYDCVEGAKFGINLTTLLECLQIFGPGSLAQTSVSMAYQEVYYSVCHARRVLYLWPQCWVRALETIHRTCRPMLCLSSDENHAPIGDSKREKIVQAARFTVCDKRQPYPLVVFVGVGRRDPDIVSHLLSQGIVFACAGARPKSNSLLTLSEAPASGLPRKGGKGPRDPSMLIPLPRLRAAVSLVSRPGPGCPSQSTTAHCVCVCCCCSCSFGTAERRKCSCFSCCFYRSLVPRFFEDKSESQVRNPPTLGTGLRLSREKCPRPPTHMRDNCLFCGTMLSGRDWTGLTLALLSLNLSFSTSDRLEQCFD